MEPDKCYVFYKKICNDNKKHGPDHPGFEIESFDFYRTGAKNVIAVAHHKIEAQNGRIDHQRMKNERKQRMTVQKQKYGSGTSASGTVKSGGSVKDAGRTCCYVFFNKR